MLQGQRDLLTVSKLMLSELAPLVSMQHGVFYINEGPEQDEADMKLLASYAYRERKNIANRFKPAKDWSDSARSRKSASCSPTCRRITSRSTPVWAKRRR